MVRGNLVNIKLFEDFYWFSWSEVPVLSFVVGSGKVMGGFKVTEEREHDFP